MSSKETTSALETPSFAPVPLLDVGRGNQKIRDQVLQRLGEIYDQGCFVNGPDCKELEATLAQRCGVSHAIGCASGSDALLLALLAYDIGPGDEVLVPSFTFFATASAVSRLGAKPVFVDIDPVTFNIDPKHAQACVTSNTRAIIPVHLFGQCADMAAINALADRENLVVIEDAAQAIGAAFADRPAGSMGAVGCFSFYPTKNLGGCGDGGMMTTREADVEKVLRRLANHGMEPRYYHSVIGINSRLDTFQAAALNIKMQHLDAYTQARQDNAAYYHELLQQADLGDRITLPQTDPRCFHVWNQFTIRVHADRDQVREHLRGRGVGSEVYYPVPLHAQECFQDLGYQAGDLPETERAAREVLSLPIFPELTRQEQHRVVDALCEALATGNALRKAS